MIALVGGGAIAEQGIAPIVGGVIVGRDDCDVTDYVRVERTMRFLRPDVVVFTAGVSHVATVDASDPGLWRDEVTTNLLGGYHVARAAIGVGARKLVFIASLAGLFGKPEHSGYSASKAGLVSLVQSLALEGHDAYAISPGRVDTPMRERDFPGEDSRTRLRPSAVGEVVRDILAGRYTPGDNVVLRMRGHRVLPVEVHDGDGWREKLWVGQPRTV